MLGVGLSLRVALQCEVCDRPLDFERQADDLIDAALFGAKPYAVCPGCRQATGSGADDPEYRRRARVKHFEDTGRVWPVDA